jgi:hypothetical protein
MPDMQEMSARRLLYYLAVVAGGYMVHQGITLSLLGSEAAGLLRRNSEAYALMMMPAYWDLFAGATAPDGNGGRQLIGPSWLGQGTWFLVLGTITFMLPSSLPADLGFPLPQSIITLREAPLGILVITAYLGWTRSILPSRRHTIDGLATASRIARMSYYTAVLFVAVVVDLGVVRRTTGSTIGGWMETNIEAYAAMILIPSYFDLVARSGVLRRIIWYLFLLAVPFLVQSGVLDGVVPKGLLDWVARATEGFVAALVVSAYFDVWRAPFWGSHAHRPGE